MDRLESHIWIIDDVFQILPFRVVNCIDIIVLALSTGLPNLSRETKISGANGDREKYPFSLFS